MIKYKDIQQNYLISYGQLFFIRKNRYSSYKMNL